MATKNAKELINGIPSCVRGCFQNGVDATGCNETDYDCYCYTNNHQIIVDTMYICLTNRARSLGKNCTKDEMFQMENRYWMVCEQYWEPTGTATQPASATITAQAESTKHATSTAPVITLISSKSTSSTKSSTIGSESAEKTALPTTSSMKDRDNELPIGARVGISLTVSLAAILIAVVAFLWFLERKKRIRLEEKLAVAHRDLVALGYANEKGRIYEMEGDLPTCPELGGDMRTPELMGRLRPSTDREEISSPRVFFSTASSDSSPRASTKHTVVATAADRTRGALSSVSDSISGSSRASSEAALNSSRPDSLRPSPLDLPQRGQGLK